MVYEKENYLKIAQNCFYNSFGSCVCMIICISIYKYIKSEDVYRPEILHEKPTFFSKCYQTFLLQETLKIIINLLEKVSAKLFGVFC